MLEWTTLHCHGARFLLKTDDDVFINPEVLIAIATERKKQRRGIIGKVARSWKLVRNKSSKYYIPRSQYKNAMYPNFNTGPAYLLTDDVISPLYNASLENVFFKLEDVYVTGILARKLKIKHVGHNKFYNDRIEGLNICVLKFLASVHGVSSKQMLEYWDSVANNTCPHIDDYENDWNDSF